MQQIAGNTDAAVAYAAPNISNPSAVGYHLDATCALHDLGIPVTDVSTDYDNQARSATSPTTGPDECAP